MFLKFFFFWLMETLGAMAYSRYTGFCEITDRDVLELHCIYTYIHIIGDNVPFSLSGNQLSMELLHFLLIINSI